MPVVQLTYCSAAKLTIPENRIRRNITDNSVRELADDIEKNGLLHPLVVRSTPNPSGEGMRIELVAGERRLTAIKLLFKEGKGFWCGGKNYLPDPGHVPYTYLTRISESAALEAELHENILRTDLDWKVVTAAKARLHELRTKEAEEKGENWTVLDTAKEIVQKTDKTNVGWARRSVEAATLIAENLDDDLIKNAGSEAEAHRLLLRRAEGEFIEELKRIEAEAEEKGEADPLASVLLKGDVCEVWASGAIPNDTFTAVIVDPPYGVDADKFGNAAKTVHEYEDSAENAIKLARELFHISYKLTLEDAHLFLFCDVDLFTALKTASEAAGWKPFRTPLIWHHSGAGHIPWGVDYWRREYDILLYARKGNARLSRTQPDYIPVAKERGEKADSGHGARKPPELYAYLMRLTCLPGDHVIDPCCGSGPIFPAAKQERMIAWGVEKNEEIYKSALVELNRSKLI